MASKPSTGERLGDVERLALRHAVDDVEQHDVAQFLQAGQQGERAADLSGADQRDLLACHGKSSSETGGDWRGFSANAMGKAAEMLPPPRGDVVRALHFDEAGDGALELESAVAFGIERLRAAPSAEAMRLPCAS